MILLIIARHPSRVCFERTFAHEYTNGRLPAFIASLVAPQICLSHAPDRYRQFSPIDRSVIRNRNGNNASRHPTLRDGARCLLSRLQVCGLRNGRRSSCRRKRRQLTFSLPGSCVEVDHSARRSGLIRQPQPFLYVPPHVQSTCESPSYSCGLDGT